MATVPKGIFVQQGRRGFRRSRAGEQGAEELLGTIDGQKSQRLMQAVDAINTRLPDSALRWAAQRIHQPWRTKFAKRSKRYTTQ